MKDITKIPNDILFVVFSFLSTRDLFLGITLCCKEWRNLVTSGRYQAVEDISNLKEYFWNLLGRTELQSPYFRSTEVKEGPIFSIIKFYYSGNVLTKKDGKKPLSTLPMHFFSILKTIFLIFGGMQILYFNLVTRAYSYAESGKFIPALADFTRSLELDPKDATTYSNRGATYRFSRPLLNFKGYWRSWKSS